LTFDIYLAKISKSGLQQIAATNMDGQATFKQRNPDLLILAK
jgi:hypothetical protein